MTKTLYLMRHGETMFNLSQRTQGWCDSPLTERGQEQAVNAARRIQELGLTFDRFCCSTQERAIDTLELVMQELYGEIRPYDRYKGLKESFYGIYEACPLTILEMAFAKDIDAFVPFGGEPYADMQKRMHETLTSVMEEPDVETALAVAHMRCSLAFLTLVEGQDVVGNSLTNCALMRFEYDDGKFSYKETIQTGGRDVYGNLVE